MIKSDQKSAYGQIKVDSLETRGSKPNIARLEGADYHVDTKIEARLASTTTWSNTKSAQLTKPGQVYCLKIGKTNK